MAGRAQPAADPNRGCPDGALTLELPQPDASVPNARASLEVRRGDSMSGNPVVYRWTCVTIGDSTVAVPPLSRQVFAIAADPRQLQRIEVDGKPILAHVLPDTLVELLDHPCFGWELYSGATSDWLAGSEDAYCTEPDGECLLGFGPASASLAHDPLCPEREAESQRCVRLAQVRLASPGLTRWPNRSAVPITADPIPLAALASTSATYIGSGGCTLPEVDTGTEVVGLLTGPGQRWSIAVDDAGRLTGTADQ